MDLNKFVAIGRITKDLELKKFKETNYIKFSLAVGRFKKDETDFIPCTAFNKNAENMVKYLKKGQQVSVEGRIQTSKFEKDGKQNYVTEVIVEKFYFVGNTKKEETSNIPSDYFGDMQEIEDENLPF